MMVRAQSLLVGVFFNKREMTTVNTDVHLKTNKNNTKTILA